MTRTYKILFTNKKTGTTNVTFVRADNEHIAKKYAEEEFGENLISISEKQAIIKAEG